MSRCLARNAARRLKKEDKEMHKFKAIMRAIFYRLPKPGDTYEEDKPKRNPWAEVPLFRILETKAGWVRFEPYHPESKSYTEEYMSRTDFHYYFKKKSKKKSGGSH
jgi:hypothetical protein